MSSRDNLKRKREEMAEAIMVDIRNSLTNLNYDYVYLASETHEEIVNILLERVSHTIEQIGFEGALHYAIETDRKFNMNHPFNNTPEKNLRVLKKKQEILNKEIKFWENVANGS